MMSGASRVRRRIRPRYDSLIFSTFEALRGRLTVKFDPNDPSSVDLAIADVEAAIDAKVASFRGKRDRRAVRRGHKSGDGKRSVAEWPKLRRPSSTLM